MSYTKHIDPEESIGDSLNTINLNYSNLDIGLTDISATSHAWVLQNKNTINNINTWYTRNSAYQFNVNAYVQDTSSTLSDVTGWSHSTSTNTKNSITWTQQNSSKHETAYSWMFRNSAIFNTIVRNFTFQVTPNYTIYPVTTNTNINSINVRMKYSGLYGGEKNKLDGDYSVLVGGSDNEVIGNYSGLVGGSNNGINGAKNTINGGSENSINGTHSSIIGGSQNILNGNFSCIVGGANNTNEHDNTFVLGSNIITQAPDTTYINNLNISDPPVTITSESVLFRDENGDIKVGFLNNIQSYSLLFSLFGSLSSTLQKVSESYKRGGIAQKYVESIISESSNQEFTITHNLNTISCTVQCIDSINQSVTIPAIRINEDEVVVTVPTPGTFTIVIIG